MDRRLEVGGLPNYLALPSVAILVQPRARRPYRSADARDSCSLTHPQSTSSQGCLLSSSRFASCGFGQKQTTSLVSRRQRTEQVMAVASAPPRSIGSWLTRRLSRPSAHQEPPDNFVAPNTSRVYVAGDKLAIPEIVSSLPLTHVELYPSLKIRIAVSPLLFSAPTHVVQPGRPLDDRVAVKDLPQAGHKLPCAKTIAFRRTTGVSDASGGTIENLTRASSWP